MIDNESAADARRADHARTQLIRDIREIKKLGDNMVQKTETAFKKAPVVIGLGAAGVALITVIVYASRSGSSRPRFATHRSFFGEALRNAALSVLGMVAARVTQRALLAVIPEEPESKPDHAAAASAGP